MKSFLFFNLVWPNNYLASRILIGKRMKMGSLGQKKIEQAVVKILSDSLAQTDRLIEDDSRLVEDLYVDSIVLVEVVMELNKNFGVELPESEIAGWKTVRDICCSLGCSTGDLKFQM